MDIPVVTLATLASDISYKVVVWSDAATFPINPRIFCQIVGGILKSVPHVRWAINRTNKRGACPRGRMVQKLIRS